MSLCLVVGLGSCVSAGKYRMMHQEAIQCTVRDSIHAVELEYRKRENTALVAKTNALSEALGQQKTYNEQVQGDLTALRQQAGTSTAQWVAQKETLEARLQAQDASLQRTTNVLQQYLSAQQARHNALQNLHDRCATAYADNADVTLALNAETIEITFAEHALFENNGLLVNGTGRTNLTALATLLNEQPTLQVEVVAHTDNILPPKEKSLKDTWAWSLERATNVVRIFVRELNVNANQLTPIGKGEFTPIASNETSEGRMQNRRTVMVLRPVLAAWPPLPH